MSVADIDKAGDIVEFLENSDCNVIVTGKAGTGKSVQLKRFRERNKDRMLVVAPTGIAALNCHGETIHRVFRLPIRPIVDCPEEIRACASRVGSELKTATTLLVDEIGMIRADTWDVIDRILRIVKRRDEPFGGVRIVGFGDLYQLPPIVKSDEVEYFKQRYGSDKGYFFTSSVMQGSPFTVIELTKVFRQKDDRFISILNSARVGSLSDEQISLLNTRHRPDFKAADGFVTLCPRNSTAESINKERLSSLKGKTFSYEAECSDDFPKSARPNDDWVNLKVGCQVMIIKNIYVDEGKMLPNGAVGIVKSLSPKAVEVELDGRDWMIGYETWESHKTFVDGGKLKSNCVGEFKQIPLKLGWACTIHKSQGVTLEKCIINMEGGAFADGQTYVALGPWRSLAGIVLKSKIHKSDIRADQSLSDFTVESKMHGRYVEFEQDSLPDVAGGVVEIDPLQVISNGARSNGWLSEDEFTAVIDVMNSAKSENIVACSKLTVSRMIDEIRCLRTEISDLRSIVEAVDA